MLNFGFAGFGQVGGLFADAAKVKGYPSLAFNTASIDLNVLSHLDKQEKIHLSGYEGAGKDRSIGAEAFFCHQEMISQRLTDCFQDCHAIFPVFAVGGGTGSGVSALAARLLSEIFKEKVISPIICLPDSEESPRAKMNALEAFSEISLIEDLGACFIIDNQKVMDLNLSLGLKERYRSVRHELIDMLHFFNTATGKESDVSNLDKMDLLTALSERGSAVAVGFDIDRDDAKDLAKSGPRLLKAIDGSVFAEVDPAHMSKAAVVLEHPASAVLSSKAETLFLQVGNPLEIFAGVYDNPKKTRISALLSGMPFPVGTLKAMEEDVRKHENSIIQRIDFSRSQSFDVKSSWTTSLRRNRKIKV